ncbi:hypothetical protein O3P69_000209 [Scylla paramamosain]|uniref:Secreted protein n=1 Tax=Scylla paramamosain TaxID=85552 RepID=A0AAW0UWB5_SCYPA
MASSSAWWRRWCSSVSARCLWRRRLLWVMAASSSSGRGSTRLQPRARGEARHAHQQPNNKQFFPRVSVGQSALLRQVFGGSNADKK